MHNAQGMRPRSICDGYTPFGKDVQLSLCGQLNGERRAKTGLAPLLDRSRHLPSLHIEALIPHQLRQVNVCLLQQCMACILKDLQTRDGYCTAQWSNP